MPLYFVRVLWHGHPHRLQAEMTSACVLEAHDEKHAERQGWLLVYAETDSENALEMCDVEVESLNQHISRWGDTLADYYHQYHDKVTADLFYRKHGLYPGEHANDPYDGNQLPVWA